MDHAQRHYYSTLRHQHHIRAHGVGGGHPNQIEDTLEGKGILRLEEQRMRKDAPGVSDHPRIRYGRARGITSV